MSGSTATCLLTILYIMVKRDSFLLVSSDFHFRSSSRYVTLDLLWYRLFDKSCAPPLDHFNFVDVYPFVWVQTQLANSTIGLTIDVYAVSLVLVDAIFKFLLKNPMVLFALVVTEVICWPQSKVLLVIHPRYLAELTCGRRWLLRLYL